MDLTRGYDRRYLNKREGGVFGREDTVRFESMFQFRKSRPAPEPKKAAVGQIEAKKPLPSSSGQSVSESDESMSSLADSSVSTSSSDREKQIFTRAQVAAHCYQHDLW